MGQWLSWIKSNEKELLTILDNLAKKAVETSEAVVVLFEDLSNVEQAAKVHQLETEADVLTRDIFSELNKTFITPLDREDMQRMVIRDSLRVLAEADRPNTIVDLDHAWPEDEGHWRRQWQPPSASPLITRSLDEIRSMHRQM